MITVGGLPGTGTTTVCRLLSEALGLEHIYAGDIFRRMAEEKGMDLVEFNVYSETHPEVDRDLDARQIELAGKGGLVLEGRMSGFMLHREGIRSFNVWLTCSIDEKVRRLVEREQGDPEERAREIEAREASERKRYTDLYGFDPADRQQLLTTFDLVLDTTEVPAEDVASLIANAYRGWSSG